MPVASHVLLRTCAWTLLVSAVSSLPALSATPQASDLVVTSGDACGVWSKISTPTAPPTRQFTQHAYDPVRRRLIIFSGMHQGDLVGGLWAYSVDSRSWSALTAAGPGPRAGWGRGTIYDPVRDRMLVFDGDTLWALSLTGTPTWTTVATSGAAAKFPLNGSCVYDPVRDRVIVFGGQPVLNYTDDTWVLSLASATPNWSKLDLLHKPPAMGGQWSVYDPVRDRMLLFGRDLWALELSGTPRWTKIAPPHSGLPAVAGPAIYDAARDRVVVYGRPQNSLTIGETWAITFKHGAESVNLTPIVGPGPVTSAALVHDPISDELVLFGDSDYSNPSETWRLPLGLQPDVAIEPPNSGTIARSPPTACLGSGSTVMLTADPAAGGYSFYRWSGDVSMTANPTPVVMNGHKAIVAHFAPPGGFTLATLVSPEAVGTVARSPDLAGYAPGSVVTLTPGPVPGAAFSHWSGDASGTANPLLLTMDGTKRVVAHFVNGPAPCGTWSVLVTDEPPLPRIRPYVMHDPSRRRLIVYAGVDDDWEYLEDLWSYALDTGTWTPLGYTGDGPGGRNYGATLYDPVRDRILVFQSAVWSLSLSGTPHWSLLSTAGGPGASGMIAYDSQRDRVLMFTGATFVEAWELALSGGTLEWRSLAVDDVHDPPPARHGAATLYDPVRDRVLVFGGESPTYSTYYDDLWALEFGGTPRWTQLSPAGGVPPARVNAAAVYDAPRDRMMIYGGEVLYGSAALDTWAISLRDGPATANLTPLVGTLPGQREVPSLAFDSVGDQVVLFGGYDGTHVPSSDLFRLPLGTMVDVAVEPEGTGTVARNPSTPCVSGSLTLTAQPASGYEFAGWSGDASGSANPLILSVGGSKSIVAHFRIPGTFTLSVSADPTKGGVVTPLPRGPVHPSGRVVTLLATPALGWMFTGWSGAVTGTANPIEVTMDGDRDVVAHFALGPPEIVRFDPAAGPVHSRVWIYGGGFTGATDLAFGGLPAAFLVASDTSIAAQVPAGAEDGPIHVTTPRGMSTSVPIFDVTPQPPAGVNLSWEDCGGHGTGLKTFACDTNEGAPLSLFASFVAPYGVLEMRSLEARVIIRSNSAALPSWWDRQCRGYLGFLPLVAYPEEPYSCADPYGGQATLNSWNYTIGYQANQAHLWLHISLPSTAGRPLTQGTEYHAFRVDIPRASTTGAGACAGCDQPVCILLSQIELFQPASQGGIPVLDLPRDRNFVTWQSAAAICALTTPVQAAVIESELAPDRVRLVWLAMGFDEATVERRVEGGAWRSVARLLPDGNHRLTYEDTDVVPGAVYGYRLAIVESGTPRFVGETSITVPLPARLAIERVTWDRGGKSGDVAFWLPERGDATLEVFDLSGRRTARHRYESFAAGRHEARLSSTLTLAPGVYFVRLAQGRSVAKERFVVIP